MNKKVEIEVPEKVLKFLTAYSKVSGESVQHIMQREIGQIPKKMNYAIALVKIPEVNSK